VEDTADPLPSLLVAGDSDLSDGEGGATGDSVGDLLRRGVAGVADCVAEEEATGDRAAEDHRRTAETAARARSREIAQRRVAPTRSDWMALDTRDLARIPILIWPENQHRNA
jgi:hypothetical protein